MNGMKRRIALLILAALIVAVAPGPSAAADSGTPPRIEAGIATISKYGNIVLDVGAESFTELGYKPADIVSVRIGDAGMEMPIGTSYSDVDSGDAICCFKTGSSGADVVVLAVNSGDLASSMGVAERRTIKEAPGYEWIYDEEATVTISMAQEQGYAEEYALHQICGARSNKRGDYPNLSDAEYANFRAVETSGMGKGALFRSSSPIDPALNRNREADEALRLSRIRTVMNMADSEEEMKAFADFDLTSYAKCDVIALGMGVDIMSEAYRQKLAEGFRWLNSHDGPWLIHCKEGRERSGFAAAILECLMGATADEITADYMLTYYNYYGIIPGTEPYRRIAEGNIEASLARVFQIPSIRAEGVDLRACAEGYLVQLGMSGEEISSLREKLGKDYGGLL